MKKICVGFAFICCTCMVANAQLDTSALSSIIEKNKRFFNGSNVTLVYQQGKPVYKKVVGEDINEKGEIKLGNLSQLLVTALVLQFVDQGKLDLDAKVADYLPIFATYGKKYITVRHCLAHMTGIDSKSSAYTDLPKAETLEALVNEYPKKEIRANAGTDFYFGIMGPNIAARILEVITKKDFEQLMIKQLLKPMGMKSTNFSNPNGGCAVPANGGISTPNDFMAFLTMLTNKGMHNGQQILSEKSIEFMLQTQIDQKMVKNTTPVTEGLDFGLGAFVKEKDANGKATAICMPSGIGGSWVTVDFCKGYIFGSFFGRPVPADSKIAIKQLDKTLSESLLNNCK